MNFDTGAYTCYMKLSIYPGLPRFSMAIESRCNNESVLHFIVQNTSENAHVIYDCGAVNKALNKSEFFADCLRKLLTAP